MKQRRIDTTLTIAALALTLFILTALPLAGTAAPRLERQPLESLTALNSTEATERGAPFSVVSVPSVASVVQSPGTATTADAQNVELVGHIGGQSYAIAIEGDYAYVGFGPELAVLDISDPTHPTQIGYVVLPDLVHDVAVVGDYAYVANWYAGLRVISVANPTQPTEVGYYDTLGIAIGVAVAGDYAYIADYDFGLRVISVADPTQPMEVGAYDTPGEAEGVAVAGGYAYVADYGSGLRVVDISNPAAPVEVGAYDTPGYAFSVYVAGGYAYVAGWSGLWVISVADPTQPVEVAYHDMLEYAMSVAVAGDYAYVAGWVSLRVISVADPTQPMEVGAYDLPLASSSRLDVAVAGDYAYVADVDFGLRVISVADPAELSEMGSYDPPGNALGVAVAEGYAYVVGWWHIWDDGKLCAISVADATHPTEVGYSDTPGYNTNVYGVAVAGSYAYVIGDKNYPYRDGWLQVISVVDPTQPMKVGYYDTPGEARDVVVAGDYAYVAEEDAGLQVISVADPTQPVEMGHYDTPGYAVGVSVAGNYAYVADGLAGLRVISVADPTQPVEVGHYDMPGGAVGVAVAGGYTYVAGTSSYPDYNGWLRVISVADPTQPVEVGHYDMPGEAHYVAVVGDYAYVTDDELGLWVIDISNPAAPVGVGFYDTPGFAGDIYVAGGYTYIANGTSGLFILRFTGGPGPTYSVSGQVTDADGNPISDVTISDGAGHTATTDSNGNYTISDLSAGTYTLTPSKSDYTFSPTSRTVSVPPSATGQDFTGTPTPPPPLDKPPVVLVHGWAGASGEGFRCKQGIWRVNPEVPNTFGTFGEMAKWLDEDGGFDVWIAHLDTGPDGTPRLEANAWGAECLKDQIAYVKQVTGAHQVILIAHSMGGLVSRAYIEGPEYETDVQALFTLGSPHAGIPIDSIIDGLPDWSESYCEDQEAVCQMSEVAMYVWNRVYGSISHGVTPPYYLIGGDKSDSILGEILKSCGVDPNDGCVGTRSAQALKDGSSAIQSDVRERYQTHETHSKGFGYPSYFQPPSGQVHSQSYQCIQNVLLGTSNPCAGPSSAALSAQAALSLTGHTSDVHGHLNTGETAEHTLQVDADGASLFYLSWVTGTLSITLTNPVGTVIDPAYAAANTDVVTYTTSPGSEMTPPFAAYAFTTTVPGLYTVTITAGDVGITGTDYLLFAAMETTRTLSVALDSDHYQISDMAVLTATLEGAGSGITGATVQATFSRSDAITDTLTLTDQGDGTYRGTYAIPNAPGYLHLRVTAEGSDAGAQFNRQVDRLLTVASQTVQLTGAYADRADDADGNGRYETLTVDVEVLAAGAGDFTFSADLVNGGDQFVAHVITQTALITDTQSVPLSFDGELIQGGGSDGPFTVTNLLISDPQNAGIPSVMADDVWTTAAYDHTQFGWISGDMNGDCIVTVVDIMLVASRWGTNIGDIRYDAAYDLDNSGNIDIVDIMIVATHWRERCE